MLTLSRNHDMLYFFEHHGEQQECIGTYDLKNWIWHNHQTGLKQDQDRLELFYFYYEYAKNKNYTIPNCLDIVKKAKVFSYDDGHLYDGYIFVVCTIENVNIIIDEEACEWMVSIEDAGFELGLEYLWSILVPLYCIRKSMDVHTQNHIVFETGEVTLPLSAWMDPSFYLSYPSIAVHELIMATASWCDDEPSCHDEIPLMLY